VIGRRKSGLHVVEDRQPTIGELTDGKPLGKDVATAQVELSRRTSKPLLACTVGEVEQAVVRCGVMREKMRRRAVLERMAGGSGRWPIRRGVGYVAGEAFLRSVLVSVRGRA
jgi:hypothetical protein